MADIQTYTEPINLGDWFEFDFHVHTPCSHDFQGIGKEDKGFIWLLERAKEAGLNVIAITDHNDISGYHKLCEIENDLRRTQRTLERNGDPIPISIMNQLLLFDQIQILPGVELDVYPNIHLIVLFDPQRTEEISTFIVNAGYTPEIRGEATASKYGKWNIEDTLQEAEKINAIVIAAHVDSNKGLYNESKDWGQKRISAFSNDNLYGMEFINSIQRDKIISLMKNQDYSRKTRLAFIQSSDFHGLPEQNIGERRTYVRMDRVNIKDKIAIFKSIRKAFRDPDEYISAPERPEIQEILKKLNDKPFVANLIEQKDQQNFLKNVCAFANSEDGTIAIGKNSFGNWVGIKEYKQESLADSISVLIKNNIFPAPTFSTQIYQHSAQNLIATVRIQKNDKLCINNQDDKIYIYKKSLIVPITCQEIINLAEERLINRYSGLSITERIDTISQKLKGAEDSIDILPIVRKIDAQCAPLRKCFSFPDFGVVSDEIREDILFKDNGCVDGNIIVTEFYKPRDTDHYIRFSAPIGTYNQDFEKNNTEYPTFSGEKIIIVPGGAVYYDNHDKIIVSCELYPPYIFTTKENNTNMSLKFIAAYLKSSIAIWFAERCLGSFDMRRSAIMNIPIPTCNESGLIGKIESEVDQIISLECTFLDAQAELLSNYPTKELQKSDEYSELFNILVNSHNTSAHQLMGNIDNYFYSLFSLSSNDIAMIEKVLKSLDFITFPSKFDVEE